MNLGVLGHVDCGKTSLGEFIDLFEFTRRLVCACDRVVAVGTEMAAPDSGPHRSFRLVTFLFAVAALSSILSTAALDKHPQSKERGITLDLGFSSFTVCACACLRLRSETRHAHSVL